MLAKEAVIVRDALDPSISKEARKVRDALVAKGLETPMVETGLTNEQKRERIETAMRDVMDTLGLDLTDDSLTDTPAPVSYTHLTLPTTPYV